MKWRVAKWAFTLQIATPKPISSSDITTDPRTTFHLPSPLTHGYSRDPWIIRAPRRRFPRRCRAESIRSPTPSRAPLTSTDQEKQSERGKGWESGLNGAGQRLCKRSFSRGTVMLLRRWVKVGVGVGGWMVWIVWPHSACSQEKEAKNPSAGQGLPW